MGPKKQAKNVVQEAPKQPQAPPPQHTLTGFGRFQYLNGNIYEGNWRIIDNEKIKQGHGKLILSNFIQGFRQQQSYEGNWASDKMQGFGIYTYANGDVYTGEWHDNKHQGKGKMEFGNGTLYDGQWKNHKIQGYGSYKDEKGRVWQGQFRNNQFKSRMQMHLSKQRQKQVRKKQIKTQIDELLSKIITILQDQSQSQMNIDVFFANKDNVKDILKDTKVGFESKTKEQWLSILKNVDQPNYYILDSNTESRSVQIQNIMAQQSSGKGQIVEIQTKQGKGGRLFLIDLGKDRWVIGGLNQNK